MGCSPMDKAQPVVEKCDCAMTATSESGSCKGPTHCCCAMRPVTERSTLFVRNLLEPTESRRRTRSSAEGTVASVGRESGLQVEE